MVRLNTFRVGFLFAFSVPRVTPEKAGKSKKKEKKTSKKSKEKKSEEAIQKEEPTKPDYILEVGNPIGYVHVEYDLIPNREKQQFDVVCWKGVAKVFSKEEETCYRVKVIEDKIWVPVFIQHSANPLDTEELLQLHQHVICFQISTNKNKISQKAKSENTKIFYLKEDDVSSESLVPVFTEDPNLVTLTAKSRMTFLNDFMKELIEECIYAPGQKNKNEIVTKLNFGDVTHQHWMTKIIKQSGTSNFFFKEFIPISPPPVTNMDEILEKKRSVRGEITKEGKKLKKAEKSKEEKKSKAGKKSKEGKKSKTKPKSKSGDQPKKSTEMVVKVSGEIFFTDPSLALYDVRNPNDVVTNGYVILSVDKLMTRQQKYDLNPLIVKIDKIDDLNVDVLKKAKFKSIFVRYNIPFVAQGKTIEREIQQHIRFSESHAHFTHDLQSMKFVEFIQSRRFFVEICGKKDDVQSEIEPSLFGTELGDKNISKRLTPTETLLKLKKLKETIRNEEEVLAVVSYDLTPLLIPTWRVSSNETCHNPDNIQYQKGKYSPFAVDDNFVTTNNTNMKTLYREKCRSPFSEWCLIDSGTTLKMEFSFAAPICLVTHSVLAKAENFNRMFLVISNPTMAVEILDFLLSRNQHLDIIGIAPNRTRNVDEMIVDTEEYMTGFIIDNGSSFAFYIEGDVKDYMKPLWEKMMRASPEDVKVYYNDAMVFAKRQYAYFVKLGGFLIITMQRSLKDILAMEKVYIQGYLPLLCWEAVKKLDLLFRCTTLKAMNQYNLFPSVDELLSFDLEFGSALRWNERFPSAQQLPSLYSATFMSYDDSFSLKSDQRNKYI